MYQLQTQGFVVVPGPFPKADLGPLTDTYDAVVASAAPEYIGNGSNDLRVSGLVNAAPRFHRIFTHRPLLDAAAEVIGAACKLSAFLARSVRPVSAAQKLHRDFEPLADGWPMVGFIFMVDDFGPDNGATRFVRGSQHLAALPPSPETIPACGPAGSMILFNGSIWHGYGANLTDKPRRSIQGALIRRDQQSAVDHASQTHPDLAASLSATARYLLDLQP